MGLRRLELIGVDLARGALDRIRLALLALLRLSRALRVGNLRQPRVKPRDGVVQLTGDTELLRGVVARGDTRNLLDLAGDGIEPLVDVGNIAARLGRRTEIGRSSVAEIGIDPLVERQACPARGGLGPLADGRINPLDIPRYARVHASVRFRSGAPTRRLRPPRASQSKDNRILRGSSASNPDFCVSR